MGTDWEKSTVDYDKTVDYYSTLGIDEHEPRDGVEDAYQRLSKVYTPESTAFKTDDIGSDMAKKWMEALQKAHAVLSHNPTRRCYDRDRDTLNRVAKNWPDALKAKQRMLRIMPTDLQALFSRPVGVASVTKTGNSMKLPDSYRSL